MDATPPADVRSFRESLRQSRAVPVLSPEDVARAQAAGAAPIEPIDPEKTACMEVARTMGRAAMKAAIAATAKSISGGTPHVG